MRPAVRLFRALEKIGREPKVYLFMIIVVFVLLFVLIRFVGVLLSPS